MDRHDPGRILFLSLFFFDKLYLQRFFRDDFMFRAASRTSDDISEFRCLVFDGNRRITFLAGWHTFFLADYGSIISIIR